MAIIFQFSIISISIIHIVSILYIYIVRFDFYMYIFNYYSHNLLIFILLLTCSICITLKNLTIHYVHLMAWIWGLELSNCDESKRIPIYQDLNLITTTSLYRTKFAFRDLISNPWIISRSRRVINEGQNIDMIRSLLCVHFKLRLKFVVDVGLFPFSLPSVDEK